jgi:hypothetical protein
VVLQSLVYVQQETLHLVLLQPSLGDLIHVSKFNTKITNNIRSKSLSSSKPIPQLPPPPSSSPSERPNALHHRPRHSRDIEHRCARCTQLIEMMHKEHANKSLASDVTLHTSQVTGHRSHVTRHAPAQEHRLCRECEHGTVQRGVAQQLLHTAATGGVDLKSK